jgi:hypothetical protein
VLLLFVSWIYLSRLKNAGFQLGRGIACLRLFACICLSSCSEIHTNSDGNPMIEKLYEIPEDCDFMTVNNDDAGENECTPKLLDPYFSEFSGILINGPKEVVWSGDISPQDFPESPWGGTSGPLRLMIAGLVRLKYSTLGLNGDFSGDVLVVAVDQKTAQTYSGKMPQVDFLPEPEPDVDTGAMMTEADRNMLITSMFNLDLVHDLDLPIIDATYSVYATLGEYKSNVLTITTKVE